MSFLSGIGNFLGGVSNFFKGNSLASTLAKTALSAYALNRITNSINRTTQSNVVDQGVELQLDPDTSNKIPVVYGKATIGGNITDVEMAANNLTLWVCLTLCEQTGTNIAGTQSVISFEKIYMDGFELVFKADGVTADYLVDVESNQDDRVDGLIQVFCYADGSANQVFPTGYSGTTATAYSRFPNWNSNKAMNDLVFALVKVTYNSEKKITSFPDFKFALSNTLTKPGDCLYDFMTNGRYGAGIPSSEIDV
jgi:hypothetical protein